ncbi:methylamine utilization protein MauJ [Exiguobacterium sp. AB2]|uniref:methylamine utilization protein MauJ n=1 Tax=Exiguobacterium sp. AB2 TaxID=1484479 RepID=UPI0004A8AB24|nr:methylamine utilization protein MauJ [Exiguobacterium sp. AB2]KDN57502.1 hypothetical protein DI14_13570 [Exiguobacterium sp. AB2]
MRRTWRIDFDLVGPISIATNRLMRQPKGFSNQQFYSDVSITSASYGLKVTVTAFADNMQDAEIAAHVYLGRMRDVLTSLIDLPIQIETHETALSVKTRFSSRILLDKSDFELAFKKARFYEKHHPKLLQAMGWYSKAKLSTNAYDQFFAYWNAIEILGTAYHTETAKTKSGTINKIYQSFLDHFGPESEWPVQNDWINTYHGLRSRLYHGGTGTTLKEILNISSKIPSLSDTAIKFIHEIVNQIEVK